MEERISKKESRTMFFEQSGQQLKVAIECEDIFPGDVCKLKDFLETMFKEILSSI